MNDINTIDEVIEELGRIIDKSVLDNNFLGVFAYVYQRTTIQIKEGMEEGRFENPKRMEKFDVVFAGYYIRAYHIFHQGGTPSQSWLTCFESAQQPLSILQHIMIGMNAHICLDLGIATAEISRGKDIHELEGDFNKVNDILEELIDTIQTSIGRTSWLVGLIDRFAGRVDEKLIDLGIRNFRGRAWQIALEISEASSDDEKSGLIKKFDQQVADLNRSILHPEKKLIRIFWWLVRLFEKKDVGKIIQSLRSKEPQGNFPIRSSSL
jgi:hypothetical protein